jgi:hypothetical protein
LRLKLQAIAIDARVRDAWRVDPTGTAVESAEAIDDFSVRNLGFQIRYRYEIAPLSYLYVVYGRGGFDQQVGTESTSRLLDDSFSLRDSDQLLVKFRISPAAGCCRVPVAGTSHCSGRPGRGSTQCHPAGTERVRSGM